MLTIRPAIGSLGYFLIGKSYSRLVFALFLFGVTSFFLLRRSKESVSLYFMVPVLGGSSVIFLSPPDYTSMNSFDACAVESALNPIPSLRETTSLPTTRSRPVYLYLWGSNVAPSDTWLKLLSRIQGITILYLNLVKSLIKSPAEGMLSAGGWGGRPGWAIWMASGGSLLWRSGGILLPTGVLMTKPIVLEAFGNNSGLLVAKRNKIFPVAFGTPPHHPVVNRILDSVQNFNYTFYNSFTYQKHLETPMEILLSNAVSSVCDVSNAEKMLEGDCKDFMIIDRSAVMDINLEKQSSLKEEDAMFLRYTGDPYILRSDLVQSLRFFRKHALARYCPQIFEYLEYEVKNLL